MLEERTAKTNGCHCPETLPCMCLQMKTTTECSYLEGKGPEQIGAYLRHFSLYESRDMARGRSVLALSMPVEAR